MPAPTIGRWIAAEIIIMSASAGFAAKDACGIFRVTDARAPSILDIGFFEWISDQSRSVKLKKETALEEIDTAQRIVIGKRTGLF
jgi:hypothetical protein